MVWREPQNHFDDCYFCLVNINGINRNNRSKWTYPDLVSARRPDPHSELEPIQRLTSYQSSVRTSIVPLITLLILMKVKVILRGCHEFLNVSTRMS
ncbi:hypothetical protein AVEN_174668-1 [Araneus ventricosus]|uniref:Uncharacterized protein n=1 Tax=Araneus ventricosus TaxID=182803 RepID=A0A4Y2BM88_ARAVE|nr:hypothetical protein AVEN_174668-1 [Araneus ventricosus]